MLKFVHFKKPVTQSSFLAKSVVIFNITTTNMTTLFERNEDRVTGFLKWTDFRYRFNFWRYLISIKIATLTDLILYFAPLEFLVQKLFRLHFHSILSFKRSKSILKSNIWLRNLKVSHENISSLFTNYTGARPQNLTEYWVEDTNSSTEPRRKLALLSQ